MSQEKIQTFNDGIADIYSVSNIASPGDMPKIKLDLKIKGLRYSEKIVGMSRFWAAKQDQTKIEQLLRFPRVNSVKRDDIVIPIDGNQYRIVQVQYPPKKEVLRSCMDLSLERIDADYEIAGS